MDSKDGGTETQMINNNLANKPRPPPQILKPKPSLPKKPAIAAKPGTLLQKSSSINDPQTSPRPKPPVTEKAASPHNNHGSPTRGSPTRTSTSRPKEPPPPLPRAAPKGPSVHKTPPPLPKTPPRASLKNKDNRDQESKINGDKTVNGGVESDVVPPVKQVISSCNDARSESPSEVDKRLENDSVEEIPENDNENFAFANLKSKFVSANSSSNSVPKVPDKPKPSSKVKPSERKVKTSEAIANEPVQKCEDSNDKSKAKTADIVVEMQAGQSKWFVNHDNQEEDKPVEKYVDNNSGIHFLKGQGKSTADSTVWFNKPTISPKPSPLNSPKNSPIMARKPPPKVTPKPKSVCDPNSAVDNEKHSSASSSVHSSPEKSSLKQSELQTDTFQTNDRDQNMIHGHEIVVNQTDNSNDVNSSTERPKPKGSPKPLPKPVPRKPAPLARPRPTPRKRLSINRLSGSDETFDNLGSSDTNSNQSDKVVSDNATTPVADATRSPSEEELLNNTNTQPGTSSAEDTRASKTSVEEEVQYRVIDKHIRSKSHITELEHDVQADDQVILRAKIVKETTEDEGEELTLEELQSIGHLLESSDDENHEHDKFVRKVELPVENDKEKLSNESTKVVDEFSVEIKSKNPIDTCESNDNEKTNAFDSSVNDVHISEGTDVDNKNVKNSVADMLEDESILEPSSLLNEIEDILTRSFKHSSLTRSGSSPEKKSSPYLNGSGVCKTSRSHSVDVSSEAPVRPPRPKKEQKRLRSMSQAVYDSCGSDTESLPDMSRHREELCNSTNMSLTLGKAKPHPPKPKRHKLLKVQRSQSDVTSMKSVVDKMDSPKQNHLSPSPAQSNKSSNDTKGRPSPFKKRPTRRAPDPPSGPALKVTPPSSSRLSLDTKVPVDARVKSMSLDSRDVMKNKRDVMSMMSPGGTFYHSINDDELSSDGDHDYQDISDDNDKSSKVDKSSRRPVHHMMMDKKHKNNKTVSPPKLPPRNMNNSHSFDNSSLSSAGHDFDSVITSVASSAEDMSISSGCFEQDIGSPGIKNPLILRSMYPKTSSPYVKGNKTQSQSDENMHISGLVPSNSSLSDCLDDRRLRPVSGCSAQSDSWSGSAGPEQSSSDSDLDDEEKISRKREKKLFMIAQEITSSERVFVDVLKLLNVDFRLHVTSATENLGRPIIPTETLNRILDYLPQLEIFNEGLLKDLEDRMKHWEENKCISDIFVKKGPFLKLYSSYIRDFETITSTFDEALKKHSQFQATVKEFELSPRCASLALKHYMLKPIQRIPQYRLLLQDYMKHLPADCPEMKDMQTALAIVSEVAHHANENMRREDYVQKMLEIQRSLIGQFEVIKPGRLFLKEGELKKLSRKEMQPRYFFLFNDVLLYTTPVATGYRLNNVLPLAGMKVSVAAQDEYKMEFSIISVQRSFTLHGTTLEERDDWVTALNAAIEENALKRNTFEAVRAGAQALLDKDFVLGHKAPLWIPDARVTMCMLCTCEFTVTWRRHHCRACGWVVCGNCSEGKAPLRYLKYKLARVCDKCFKTLSDEAERKSKENPEKDESGAGKDEEDGGNMLSLNGLFERFQKIRRSGRNDKKNTVRPDRLKEVSATDQDASMSGYLQKWQKGKKWKKKQWFLVRDKVLYTFKASQDTAAASSMVLLGYEVSRFNDYFEGVEAELLFQLSHANTDPVVFRTDSATATEKWVTVMRESTVA